MDFEFQPLIMNPPIKKEQLYGQACSADVVTIQSWEKIWIENIKANQIKYGPFSENGIGVLHGQFAKRPVIICGSGPGLGHSIVDKVYDEDNKIILKDGKEIPVCNLRDTKGIPIISCLHNFHFMEDNGVKVDLYVSLDAGDVTLDEISEGGERTAEQYYEISRDRVLCAFIGSSPKLLEKWQGQVLWFNAPLPKESLIAQIDECEVFHTYVSNGGNVLGACLYIAKAICGANPIIFVGADFSFSYLNKFHDWDSKYDKELGLVISAVDIFGYKVKTWQSYFNFKCWFDWVACHIGGIYINATESGIFGAYPEGNIRQVIQMSLREVIDMYALHEYLKEQCENPKTGQKLLLF